MKKVSILSMQRVDNFGSLLQSYSLKKMLSNLGADVHFLDIERFGEDDLVVGTNRLDFKKEVENNKGLLSKIKLVDKYFFNRLRIRKIADEQSCKFDDFRKKYLGICDSDNNVKYDLCVIGSDEVFNCMAPSPWGFTSQLFGNVKQANNVITYAACCGATTYDQLNAEMIDIIKKSFERVSGFSARDDNTKKFIENMTTSLVENHMDPVWVGDFEEEIKQATLKVNLPKKYCIIYSYYNRIHDKNEIEAIQRFCKEKGLEPIAIGAPQMWIKKYVAVDPFEMLKIFENADFIITDTFHGTIFSEKFNGKYAVLYRDSNKNKLSDLVSKIGAENHVINSFSELSNAYLVKSVKDDTIKMIKIEREKSLTYLQQYLK